MFENWDIYVISSKLMSWCNASTEWLSKIVQGKAPIETNTSTTLPQIQDASTPENLQLAQLPMQRREQVWTTRYSKWYYWKSFEVPGFEGGRSYNW